MKIREHRPVILAMLLISLTAIVCASCSGGGDVKYEDGTYTGQSSEDENGAYGEVTIVVKDGVIEDCEYVTWQKDGTIKGEDYGKVNGEIDNQDFYDKAQLAVRAMQQYADELAEKKDVDEVDAVSGATNSYDQFREAVDEALEGRAAS
jgi:major membrane immunogen (membrane-anchored lipoprotein)